MQLKSLVRKNRSYRRFYGNERIRAATLKGLVDIARLCASSANLQPLKYRLSSGAVTNEKIFPCLKWAGYLKDWDGPSGDEKPPAYIIILGDTRISKSFGYDAGIAAQSILLGAVEKGLGGCIIGSVDRKALAKALEIPGYLEILLVIAIGRPAEKVVIEKPGRGGDIRYWRDKKGVHHVPKRQLKDIIITPRMS